MVSHHANFYVHDHGFLGLVKGLNEVCKALDRKEALLAVLAEDCEDAKYKKLITVLLDLLYLSSNCVKPITFLFLKLRKEQNWENGQGNANMIKQVQQEELKVAPQLLSKTMVKKLKPSTLFLTTLKKISNETDAIY